METGGSSRGDPFDIEDVLNLSDMLTHFQMARRVMGDTRLKEIVGKEPDAYEADMKKRLEAARGILKKMAFS